MPTQEYAEVLFPEFGVKAYHQAGVYGSGVSVYLIDTGLTNAADGLQNVKMRSVANPMAPKHSHGSFVASIIAARPNNGLSGIAPEAQLYLADVSSSNGTIYTSGLVKAIRDATELRVDIISISLGTSVYDQALEDAVKDAVRHGALVLAASGNCSCRAYEFPSACDAAISVASMDSARRVSPFNTRNDAVAVFAPGQNISVPGAPTRLSGTSFAVPFATGLLALELSRRRQEACKEPMTRTQAIEFLRSTLGLDCAVHTYAAHGLCVPSPREPTTAEGISWFLIFAFTTGALAAYLAGRFSADRLGGLDGRLGTPGRS
jgi:subtilisin family serine protease